MVAPHPLADEQNAATELIIDPDPAVHSWALVQTASAPDVDGCIAEVGVASFGAPETLCPGLAGQSPEDLFGESEDR